MSPFFLLLISLLFNLSTTHSYAIFTPVFKLLRLPDAQMQGTQSGVPALGALLESFQTNLRCPIRLKRRESNALRKVELSKSIGMDHAGLQLVVDYLKSLSTRF